MAAAERIIEAHETVALAAGDWDLFYAALLDPPKANEPLKAAARNYRRRVGE